jgi:hypothetical protein
MIKEINFNGTTYYRRWLRANLIFIRCRRCNTESFVQRYYDNKHNVFLCEECVNSLQTGREVK